MKAVNMETIEENVEHTPGNDSVPSGSCGREKQKAKSPFTASEAKCEFNISAPPFNPPTKNGQENIDKLASVIKVGPSSVPVNKSVWSTIANNRVLPEMPRLDPQLFVNTQTLLTAPSLRQAVNFPMNVIGGYPPNTPQFEDDYSRNVVFTRKFGPVAHPDGFIEIRLRENISVLISIDRTLLLHNPNTNVKIAVASAMNLCALEHPNGKVFQQFDRIDIHAYDNKKLNKYVRYAKMWEKGISLTADGCALIYLVDSAGTRTTSDAVNKDYRSDNCWKVFTCNARLGVQFYSEAEAAAKLFHYFTQDDGTQVFDILGFRVSQTLDGMVRVNRANNRLKIHTSPTNGSATITTPSIHCTASMGQSSHLFVRRDERRMHFDGSSFVVRNAGHSSGFDDQNNLRVY